MSDFHKEAEHKGFALLFDSCKIEEKYKHAVQGQIPHFVLCDKDEKRITSMVKTAEELGTSFVTDMRSGVGAIALAKSFEDMVLLQSGLIRAEPQGFNFCMTCLAKAIFACEEQLAVLKDIQDTANEYAAKL